MKKPKGIFCPAKCGKRFLDVEAAKAHVAEAHPEFQPGVPKRKGWATPHGFADFDKPVTYEYACDFMRKIAEKFSPNSTNGVRRINKVTKE